MCIYIKFNLSKLIIIKYAEFGIIAICVVFVSFTVW